MVKFLNQFIEYHRKVKWSLFLLISIFTMGSWIDISGLWCELPLMVESLPERWRLPSILTIISQMGQIGPLIFLIGRLFFPNQFKNTNVIFIILTIGACSCFLLSLFWNKTIKIYQEERSVYLYLFNFSLSLLDSLSTLTFLPYIGEHFDKEYIIPHYIGESLSSLIPGILAIIQGVGSRTECDNSMSLNNNTFFNQTIHRYDTTRFSVSIYFCLMGALIFMSAISFSLINFCSCVKKLRKVSPNSAVIKISKKSTCYNIQELTNTSPTNENKIIDLNKSLYPSDELNMEKKYLSYEEKREISIYMFLSFLSSFINYGYLPGVLSYSTIPYGINYLYLSINLTSVCLPLSILISIFSYQVSLIRIITEFLVPTTLSVYILGSSVLSPCPPLVNHHLGGYVIVICWVLTSCIFMRVRCLIATKLERHGKNVLLSLGIFSIIGQLIGGLIIYLCVDVYRLFKDKPKCSTENICL